MSSAIEPRSYQPLGDLMLDCDLPGEVDAYRRDLNLDDAIATTQLQVGDVGLHAGSFRQRTG